LRGVRNGAKLYVVDPRQTSSARWADGWLGLDVGSDIALANAVGREILAAGLENREFVTRATAGFEEYALAVEPYTLVLVLSVAITIAGTVVGAAISALWFARVLRRFGIRVRFGPA